MDKNLKNLFLTILFVALIGTVFGFTSKNLQICIISFCFRYYLSKKDHHKFIKKKMIVYLDLKNELNSKFNTKSTFFAKERFKCWKGTFRKVRTWLFIRKVRAKSYIFAFNQKCCFRICSEAEFLPSYDDTFKFIELVDKHFAVEGEKSRQLGWCAKYALDRTRERNYFSA